MDRYLQILGDIVTTMDEWRAKLPGQSLFFLEGNIPPELMGRLYTVIKLIDSKKIDYELYINCPYHELTYHGGVIDYDSLALSSGSSSHFKISFRPQDILESIETAKAETEFNNFKFQNSQFIIDCFEAIIKNIKERHESR